MSLYRGRLLQGLSARGTSPSTTQIFRSDWHGCLLGRSLLCSANYSTSSKRWAGHGRFSGPFATGLDARRTYATSPEDEDDDDDDDNNLRRPSEPMDKWTIYERLEVDKYPERKEIADSILAEVNKHTNEHPVDPAELAAFEKQMRKKNPSKIDLSYFRDQLDKISEMGLSDMEDPETEDEAEAASGERDPLQKELEELLQEDEGESDVDFDEVLKSMEGPLFEPTEAGDADDMVPSGNPRNPIEEKAYYNLYRRYYPDRGLDYIEAEDMEEEEVDIVHSIAQQESKKAREGTKFSDKPYLNTMDNSSFWEFVGETIMKSDNVDEFLKNIEVQLKENGMHELLEQFEEAKQQDREEFGKIQKKIQKMMKGIKNAQDPLEITERLKEMKQFMRSVFDDPVISQVFDRSFGLPKEDLDDAEHVRRAHEADFKDQDYDEDVDFRDESDDENDSMFVPENVDTVIDLGTSLPQNPLKAREEEKKIVQAHGEHYLAPRKFNHRVLIQTGRHIKLKRSGRVESVSALMVIGDGKGTGGVGYGKGKNFVSASAAAIKDAIKNSFTVHLFDGRTISHPMVEKYCRDRVHLWPLGPDSGVRASNLMNNIIRCFGIKDLRVKTYGRRNMHNTLKALVKGLKSSKSEKVLAEAYGKKVFNVHKIYRPQERRRAF